MIASACQKSTVGIVFDWRGEFTGPASGHGTTSAPNTANWPVAGGDALAVLRRPTRQPALAGRRLCLGDREGHANDNEGKIMFFLGLIVGLIVGFLICAIEVTAMLKRRNLCNDDGHIIDLSKSEQI